MAKNTIRVTGKSSHELPATMCREIGRIITKWAHLEHYLNGLIYTIMEISFEVGRTAIREPRMRDRVAMIKHLARLRGFELEQTLLKRLEDNIDEHAAVRDLMAHGLWISDGGEWFVQNTRGSWSPPIPGQRKRTKIQRKLLPEGREMTLERLKKTTQAIDQMILIGKQILENLQRQNPRLPQQPPE